MDFAHNISTLIVHLLSPFGSEVDRSDLYICSAMCISLYTVGFRCKTCLELAAGPPSDGF